MAYTTAAIMASPSPLDSIRLIGDEEKHCTLLYFGETSTLPDGARDILVDSVKQAASMLPPFAEYVDHVARLGSDSPPALVAMLSNQNLEQIRNLFMMNPFVNSYLENTAQFPSFTPHVTLGYPDYDGEAALKLLMNQIERIKFDKLCVWWNDERIEIDLGRRNGDSLEMADAIGEFLEHVADLEDSDDALAHFGVKGQKWGVRRNTRDRETSARLRRVADGTASKGDRVKTFLGVDTKGLGGAYALTHPNKMADRLDRGVAKREAKAEVRAVKQASKQVAKDDKKYDASLRGVHGFIKVNNAIAEKVNPKIETLNNKAKYKDVDMLRVGNEKLHKSYLNEYRSLLQDSLDEVMTDIGTNASGTKRLQLNVVGEGLQTTWQASLDEVKHADAQTADVLNGFQIIPTFNKLGQIVGQKVEQLSMAHANEDDLNDVLAHYGIKGQKWGVRRSTDSSGLVARRSSADQIKTDRIVKKLSSGGTSALSNDDLKVFTERLRLEKEFSKAAVEHQAKADSAILRFIKKQATRQGNRLADKTVDIAVEQALAFAGVKAEKAIRFGLSDNINELNKRIKPKKK